MADQERREQVEEEYMGEDEVVENEEVEKPENEEILDEEEMKAEETEYNEVVEEDTENEQVTVINDNSGNKDINIRFDGKISFAVRMVFAIILFIVATIAIKPTNVDLSKYTDSIISSYLEKKEIIQIYNETFKEDKKEIANEDIEKLSKSISLATILNYISENELKDF